MEQHHKQVAPSLEDLKLISSRFLHDRLDLHSQDILHQWCLLMTEEEIQRVVRRLAAQINTQFAHHRQDIVIVCILKGCVYYFVDLTRELTIPHSTYFIEASSYCDGQCQEEKVEILSRLVPSKFKGKTVILLDELFDNGTTLEWVKKELVDPKNGLGLTPGDIFSSTVFQKEKQGKEKHPSPDLIGVKIPDLWVVGYGLDDKQEKRGWKLLYATPKTPGVKKVKEDEVFEDGDVGEAMYRQIRETLVAQIYSPIQ